MYCPSYTFTKQSQADLNTNRILNQIYHNTVCPMTTTRTTYLLSRDLHFTLIYPKLALLTNHTSIDGKKTYKKQHDL